jgi:hypothetical protein
MWSIGRSELRMKYLMNECFRSLYLEQGGTLIKKSIDASCIICLAIQWIDKEHRRKNIKEEVLSEWVLWLVFGVGRDVHQLLEHATLK